MSAPRDTGDVARPILFGGLASLGLLTLYLAVIGIAQDWAHAFQQFETDRAFVLAIALAFGTQVGLFAYVRAEHARAMAGGMAASTGTSTAAMLACCAHHLVDVLPVLGLSGAALFLDVYRPQLLWLGLGMNALGIAYLLWQLRRQRRMVCAEYAKPSESPAAAPCH